MNITYISSFDATDITSYSGTGYFIPSKLKEAGDSVSFIGELSKINPLEQRVKRRMYKMLGKNYLIERNPRVLNLWAERIHKSLDSSTQALVAYSSQPFAKLNSGKPKVFWTDAVFANMVDYYKVYSNLCAESINHGNLMEQQAIDNSTIAVYSSQWAAQAAIRYYGASESKVRVVPYGANIDVDYTLQDIMQRAKAKSFDVCKLLFLGVEWERKGGDIAVEVAQNLIDKGIRTRLSIVGVDPPQEVKDLDFVDAYGYIRKSEKKGLELLNNIISESHFLLLPTRADCTPIVYSELNAHGIPVITTNEGGIPSLVTDGINGFMFDKDSSPGVFADAIIDKFTHKEKYIDLSASSFNEYKTRLNWKHSISEFRKILNELI